MLNGHKRRLELLEQQGRTAVAYAWLNPGETEEDAIVRQFKDGIPNDVRITLFHWAR